MSGNERLKSAAILTVSDRCARGEREDLSGPALCKVLEEAGWQVAAEAVVPDDLLEIRRVLLDWCDGRGISLVVTTGGTGVGPRDVTPEATRVLLEKELPGLAERMRQEGRAHNPFADLSRGLVGTRGRSLLVNLPGNPGGAAQSLALLLPILEHALEMLAGAGHPEAGHDHGRAGPRESSRKCG
jgi:molybdenum cofactor synthesis domain-containing protein